MKKLLFALVLFSTLLGSGCSFGGNKEENSIYGVYVFDKAYYRCNDEQPFIVSDTIECSAEDDSDCRYDDLFFDNNLRFNPKSFDSIKIELKKNFEILVKYIPNHGSSEVKIRSNYGISPNGVICCDLFDSNEENPRVVFIGDEIVILNDDYLMTGWGSSVSYKKK